MMELPYGRQSTYIFPFTSIQAASPPIVESFLSYVAIKRCNLAWTTVRKLDYKENGQPYNR